MYSKHFYLSSLFTCATRDNSWGPTSIWRSPWRQESVAEGGEWRELVTQRAVKQSLYIAILTKQAVNIYIYMYITIYIDGFVQKWWYPPGLETNHSDMQHRRSPRVGTAVVENSSETITTIADFLMPRVADCSGQRWSQVYALFWG